jgi:hypothetical protein
MDTPASARHKRGCNCKKSLCLKKYCECYQVGAYLALPTLIMKSFFGSMFLFRTFSLEYCAVCWLIISLVFTLLLTKQLNTSAAVVQVSQDCTLST